MTWQLDPELRALHAAGNKHSAIARALGVTARTVREVVRGKTWSHVA